MKKWMCAVFSGVILLSLTACNSQSDTPKDDEAGVSATVTTTPTVQTDGTVMTDDEAITLCAGMVDTAQKIEVWYKACYSYDMTSTLPAGTTATLLNGEDYILDCEYYHFYDSFVDANNHEEVRTASDLKEIIETVYTYDVACEQYYSSTVWVEYQGELYHVAAEGIITETLDSSTICLIKKEVNAISFRIYVKGTDIAVEHTVKYVDGGWKFDEWI